MRWKKGSWKLWVLCISLQTKNWPGSSSIVGNGPLSLFNWALCQTCFQQQGQIFEWIEQAGVQEDQRRRWVYYGPAHQSVFPVVDTLQTLWANTGLPLPFSIFLWNSYYRRLCLKAFFFTFLSLLLFVTSFFFYSLFCTSPIYFYFLPLYSSRSTLHKVYTIKPSNDEKL